MSLLDIVRSGVAIANRVTAPLQALVAHQAAVLSTDGYATRTYPHAAILRPALVDGSQAQVRSLSGELTMRRAGITFLDPSVVVGEYDRLTLPDGTTGPILAIAGFIDAGTGTPMLTTVSIG